MSTRFLCLSGVVLLGSCLQAWAVPSYPNPFNNMTGPITYVDATNSDYGGFIVGNTDLNGLGLLQGNASDPTPPGPSLTNTGATDNLWRFLPAGNFGSNYDASSVSASTYESNGSIVSTVMPGEDAPRLRTTVPVTLPIGTPVHVYTYFWTDATQWRIRAGLNDTVGPLPLYAARNFQPATTQTANLGLHGENVNPSFYFANMPGGVPVLTSTPTLNLMEAYLGLGFVNGSNEVVVYIDDDDITTAADFGTVPGRDFRTRYDGIGIVEADPGTAQGLPILPDAIAPTGMTFSSAPRRRWYDPPLVNRYDFSIEAGSLFTLAGMPVGFDDEFDVYVGNSFVGSFAGGEEVDFVALLGSGVSSFSVRGIDPLVDAEDPEGFPIFLDFNTETATFTMRAVVPEPATLALIGLGAVMMLGRPAARGR